MNFLFWWVEDVERKISMCCYSSEPIPGCSYADTEPRISSCWCRWCGVCDDLKVGQMNFSFWWVEDVEREISSYRHSSEPILGCSYADTEPRISSAMPLMWSLWWLEGGQMNFSTWWVEDVEREISSYRHSSEPIPGYLSPFQAT